VERETRIYNARPSLAYGQTEGRTDRRTNIITIARRFAQTNASRAKIILTLIHICIACRRDSYPHSHISITSTLFRLSGQQNKTDMRATNKTWL